MLENLHKHIKNLKKKKKSHGWRVTSNASKREKQAFQEKKREQQNRMCIKSRFIVDIGP